ncbi:MAG: VOC family protein [Myxococcota bacterium]
MMKPLRSRFVLAVPDLRRSVTFYQEVLGLRLEFESPGWAFLGLDGFQVMLGECPDALPADTLGDHSYFAYITVQELKALAEELQAKGVECIQPLEDKSWGMRELGIRTPDGHRIMFGEVLPG